ncbi:MAG TPA: acetamidase/formamidase family protein [Bryobacteraceae bacterium]|nr:acetamidase/formamidase family protein [Bryobacteraceae bacterium]
MQRLLLWFLLAALLPAAVHDVRPKGCVKTFSHTHPVVMRIEAGDIVRTTTLDAFGGDAEGTNHCTAPANPLTGPFYVAGAESGDAVAIHLRKVRVNRGWGWTTNRLMPASLLPADRKDLYPTRYKPDLVFAGHDNLVPWDIDPKKSVLRLREPGSAKARMEFAAQPMIGCIGVAAEGDQAPDGSGSGAYGGNLDYNAVAENTTVLLPVYHRGGLIFFGDGHALQGDGELNGTGIETSLDIEFTVEIRKDARLTGPRLETAGHVISVGSQPEYRSSLDTALQMATSDMVRWLTEEFGLEPWAAHLTIALNARYDVVTLAGSMGLRIPKNVLSR